MCSRNHTQSHSHKVTKSHSHTVTQSHSHAVVRSRPRFYNVRCGAAWAVTTFLIWQHDHLPHMAASMGKFHADAAKRIEALVEQRAVVDKECSALISWFGEDAKTQPEEVARWAGSLAYSILAG